MNNNRKLIEALTERVSKLEQALSLVEFKLLKRPKFEKGDMVYEYITPFCKGAIFEVLSVRIDSPFDFNPLYHEYKYQCLEQNKRYVAEIKESALGKIEPTKPE